MIPHFAIQHRMLRFRTKNIELEMNQKKKTKNKSTAKQPLIFKLIIILIPFIILAAFEGILRLADYGDNLDLFVKNNEPGYENFMLVNPVIGKKYFQKFEYTSPANDIFYAEKPANTFRIFVMGSSTVYGFPYDRNLMFSRILNKQLEDKYPDKKIEVVNTSITAINSFTLLDYTDEILKYEPDAILIYAGHNEFYGAFGVGSNETMSRNRGLTMLHISLMKYKLYQLLRNTISSVAGVFAKGGNEVHGTLMKRMVANADILYKSDDYQLAMKCYRQNMDKILTKFEQKGIPVFLSDLVSNVKDIEPFNSVEGDSLPLAIDIYKDAEKAESEQDFEKAGQLYYYAKDLDCIRFRASEEVNEIIDELAERDNVIKVPILKQFKENSENGLIGYNFMTEHLHPNIDGAFLMSQAFLDKIVDSGIIGQSNESESYSLEYYKRNWGYTILDSLIAVHRVNNLKGFWPFVKDAGKEMNYLQTYQPKNQLDSIVISVLKNPNQILGLARLDLAQSYKKQGKMELAYKEYEALLRTNPYVAINYTDAANCLILLGDLPLALEYFKKSLEYETSFLAYYRIGEIYLAKSDFENAIRYFRQAFDIASNENKVNALGRMYIAYVYSNKNDEAKAVADELRRVNAESLLNIKPKSYTYSQYIPFQTKSQVVRAKEMANEKQFDEAIELLKRSLQIYNSHIAIRFLGELYFEQNDFDNALNYFEKVAGEFEFDPVFLYRLALIYSKKNDFVHAKKYMQELKEIAPDYGGLNELSVLIPNS